MLEKDASKRITADECLLHEAIENLGDLMEGDEDKFGSQNEYGN